MKMNNNIYTDLQFYDNTYECKSRCLECVLLFLFPPIQMFYHLIIRYIPIRKIGNSLSP